MQGRLHLPRPDDATLHAAFVSLRNELDVSFDFSGPAEHSGVASTYTHATAPLRRLADRYVGEVCVAVSAGTPVPEWVRAALPGL